MHLNLLRGDLGPRGPTVRAAGCHPQFQKQLRPVHRPCKPPSWHQAPYRAVPNGPTTSSHQRWTATAASSFLGAPFGGSGSGDQAGLVDGSPAATQEQPTSDTWLGRLVIHLLPGPAYYLISLVLPLSVFVSALGATHTAAFLHLVSAQPVVVQHLGPLSTLAATLAASQPLLTTLSIALSFTTVAYVFLAVPLLDLILGKDLRNPSREEAVRVAHSQLYRALPRIYVPLHFATLLCAMHAACAVQTHPLAALGVTLAMGFQGTIFFTVAHELLHGSKLDRVLSNMLLATVGYMHWTESHLVHHIKVATPEDPSSARRGEWLWAFLPRSIFGNLVDGYRGEAHRLAKAGLPLLCWQNRMLPWVASPLVLAAASFVVYGWKGVGFLVAQAMLAIFCLETVNYIQHYSLSRKVLPNGRYERAAPRHSWTAGFLYSNAAAFRLQRHADHHVSARKPYQNLVDIPSAPQLPANYPCMMMAATLPPLFFWIMDPLADKWQLEHQVQEADVAVGAAAGAAAAQ